LLRINEVERGSRTVVKLPVFGTESVEFGMVARSVTPIVADQTATTFLPAYGQFSLGEGCEADISFFFEPASDRPWESPRLIADRHLRTEELWLPIRGEFVVALGVAVDPFDAETPPRGEEMRCFVVRDGEAFVLRRNVWHCGPWPLHRGEAVRFFMVLSGHRKQESGTGAVDHVLREFACDGGIVPDADMLGSYLGHQ
jgi:hypothetical protein